MATKETQPEHEITKSHVILFSSPRMGHLIPMIELARRLASPHHNFMVTVITKASMASPSGKDKESFLSSISSSVNVILLPSTDHQSLNSFELTDILRSTIRSLSDLREAIRSLKPLSSIVALIADFLSVDAIAIAREFFVPFYVFFPTSLMALSSLLECRKTDREITKVFHDTPSFIFSRHFSEAFHERKIEANKMSLHKSKKIYIAGTDLGGSFQEQKNDADKMSLYMSNKIYKADGILCNSFSGMEPTLASLMMEDNSNRLPIYTIGPLVRSITDQMSDQHVNVSGYMEWLNQQPSGSVLFVSFGSEETLSSEQITELAWGLELSGHRFLWVIRCPSDLNVNTLLPERFIERNNKVGLIIQSWVQQREILGHSSTGGFLTHCGWNSVLESVMSSVPMIAWPLQAEQRKIADMLVQRIRVALTPKVHNNEREGVKAYSKLPWTHAAMMKHRNSFWRWGMNLDDMYFRTVQNPERKPITFREDFVPRDAIATVVKELMQGEAGREAWMRALELKVPGDRALAEDGSSFMNLVKWKNSLNKYFLE